jgi:predicted RNA-binding Zn-ribbon protein involved in translation (DUF1610 family)
MRLTLKIAKKLTLKPATGWLEDLRLADEIRQVLRAHARIETDRENPLRGTHRDVNAKAYIEFSTPDPDEIRRVLAEHGYAAEVELGETNDAIGLACQNCGNIAGPVLPPVCPSCEFRDIAPCPACGKDVPRQSYKRISGNLFSCPNCENLVRLRFNEPIALPDGNFNAPLVVTEVG